MKKIIIILFLIIIAVIGSYYYFGIKSTTFKQEVKGIQSLVVYQQIVPGNEIKYTLPSPQTALQLLSKTNTIKTKGAGNDAYITSIDGREAAAKNKEFWAFYINGKQSQVGAGSYIIQNEDSLLWKIEKY